MTTLAALLAPVDSLPLECDGLTRVISTLFQRDGIPHGVNIGALSVAGVGTIPHHWWIALPNGQVCDYRARMWLGKTEQVPHGIFAPDLCHVYSVSTTVDPSAVRLSETIFEILAGKQLADFCGLDACASSAAW